MSPAVLPPIDISAERLARRIAELAACGRTEAGGVDRPVYSPAWLQARDRVAGWMRELGLEVHSDAVGNLFGRLAGREPGVVLTGSHLDTVPDGGALDGALGIHAALAAVEALAKLGRPPRRSIEVVAICEEESARFPADYWGARAMAGLLRPEEADTIRDAGGQPIAAAMRARGLDPAAVASARRSDVAAFLELHIEQGRVLFERRLPLGVVQAITGQHRVRALVRGRPDHAGTTPMGLRRDAYLGAAEMALAIAAHATQRGDPAVATVGAIELVPGAVNVVPAEARFSVDVRHPDRQALVDLVEELRRTCEAIAAHRGLALAWEPWMAEPPQPMDDALRSLLADCADDLGIPWLPMTSGAGHDSQVMARVVPTAMLFVPSWEGRSHAPDEHTPVEQIIPGVRVLAAALYRLAYSPPA